MSAAPAVWGLMAAAAAGAAKAAAEADHKQLIKTRFMQYQFNNSYSYSNTINVGD